jgi:hypothetical protein
MVYAEFKNNSNLQYICVMKIKLLKSRNLLKYGYLNCHVNSYCSFAPGGVYYSIQNNKFDSNNNGCEASDIAPNLKFNIVNGAANWNCNI